MVKEALKNMFKLNRGLTVDSGAADSVFPTSWLRKALIRASVGSVRGLYYIAASGTRILNNGELTLNFFTRDGHKSSLIFQCAEINKPLCSVSHLTDNEFCVVFNRHEGRDVSYILHKPTKKRMKLRRERGVFILDAWTDIDIAPVTEMGFSRPS